MEIRGNRHGQETSPNNCVIRHYAQRDFCGKIGKRQQIHTNGRYLPMTFQSGDLILHHRYRVKAQIGAGAYGTVHRAVHVVLGVARAVKVL